MFKTIYVYQVIFYARNLFNFDIEIVDNPRKCKILLDIKPNTIVAEILLQMAYFLDILDNAYFDAFRKRCLLCTFLNQHYATDNHVKD